MPFISVMELEPGFAVTVPHEEKSWFGIATINPIGSASVNDTPVSAIGLGFVIRNCNGVVAFSAMLRVPKFFTIAGGARTVMVSFPELPEP